MVGTPYQDVLSIPKLVSYLLNYKIQNKDIHYINIAKGGENFRYNLKELESILTNKEQTNPSLCVIYSGHNEFLKYSGTTINFNKNEFNESLEKAAPLLFKLGKHPSNFKDISEAVNWLNGIEPFKKLIKEISLHKKDRKIQELLPLGFASFTDKELNKLLNKTYGKKLKKILLQHFYPNETPSINFQFDHQQNLFSKIIEYLADRSYLIRELTIRLSSDYYELDIDQRKFFDQFPDEINETITTINEYTSQITKALKLLKQHGVPCIISTVAGNYADWEPNRSVYNGTPLNKNEFKRLMDKGYAAERKSSFKEAIHHYNSALQLSSEFAETYYRLGKSYQSIGAFEDAWIAYQKAIDYDAMPIRASSLQNNFIKSLQSDDQLAIIDAVGHLRIHSSDRLIGSNLFIDGVHPNLDGYILISRLIAETINNKFNNRKTLPLISNEQIKKAFPINQKKMFNIYTSQGRYITRLSTWRYDPSKRLELSETFFLKALAINENHCEPHLGLAIGNFIRKKPSLAEKHLSKAKKLNLSRTEEYINKDWVKKIIQRAYY